MPSPWLPGACSDDLASRARYRLHAGWGPGCASVSTDGAECSVVMDGDRQITLRIDR